MTKTTLLPLLAALLLGAVAADALAQWAWRDKNGQVNASDRPPPRDIPDKDIINRPAPEPARRAAATPVAASSAWPATPTATPVKGPLDRELETRRRAAEQEQAAKTRAEEERLALQRADNCRRARNQLAALESGQRIARANDKGELEVIDDRIRASETRQARDAMASECR